MKALEEDRNGLLNSSCSVASEASPPEAFHAMHLHDTVGLPVHASRRQDYLTGVSADGDDADTRLLEFIHTLALNHPQRNVGRKADV